MAPHQQELYEQDGFTATKRKYYKVIISCVVILGVLLGLLYGLLILDIVKPAGEALEGQSTPFDDQTFRQSSTEERRTKVNLCKVNKAILLYQMDVKNDTNALPATLKDLVQAGYITSADLLDYWGQPFVYTPNVGDQPMAYELISVGIDGHHHTNDDITLKLH